MHMLGALRAYVCVHMVRTCMLKEVMCMCNQHKKIAFERQRGNLLISFVGPRQCFSHWGQEGHKQGRVLGGTRQSRDRTGVPRTTNKPFRSFWRGSRAAKGCALAMQIEAFTQCFRSRAGQGRTGRAERRKGGRFLRAAHAHGPLREHFLRL